MRATSHVPFPLSSCGDFLGQRLLQVTLGNYFKHLMQYSDGRFAQHPRFRFFALNTEMRHHAGPICTPTPTWQEDWGRHSPVNCCTSLHGTKQYWQHQRCHPLSMVDTLGLPTIFTHSTADLQWPELTQPQLHDCPCQSSPSPCRLVLLPPSAGVSQGLLSWSLSTDCLLVSTVEAPMCLAWLPGAPDVEQLILESFNRLPTG